MEYKIDTTNLTPTEIDYHIIWAKVMLGAELKDIKFLLEKLIQAGEELALSAWCRSFNYGDNSEIDKIVESRAIMDEQTAKDTIADGIYDLGKTKDEQTVKSLIEKMIQDFKTLDLIELKRKKTGKLKDVMRYFTFSGTTIKEEDAKAAMEKLLKTKTATIYEIKDAINNLYIKTKKLTPEQKTILTQIASMPFSSEFETVLLPNKQL